MQKFKFFTLAILAMLSVNFAWGADIVAYTLDPATGSNDSYAGNCDVTIDGITWNITGNSKMIPWRLGGKSITKTNRDIYSKTAIEDNITSIVVTHGTASSTTVNSFKLEVYSTAAKAASGGTGDVSSISGTFTASSTTTFTRPNGVDWSNRFYRFAYNVTISSTSNKYLQFSEATFYKAAATSTLETSANSLVFGSIENNTTKSLNTLTVSGSNLTNNITFSITGTNASYFTVTDPASISKGSGTVDATTITVQYAPKATGSHNATLRIISSGATTKEVSLTGTATAPTYTVTPQSNNTELGTVSGTTTITASPKECVGYDNPAYTVSPAGKATVNQSGNTFTVSNVTDNVTVTINFAELDKDTYVDHLHNNADIERCGSYPAPSLDDATKATTGNCDVVHYHFAGWVTDPIFTGTPGTPDDMITAGTNMTSNGRTYIAVWAKEQ